MPYVTVIGGVNIDIGGWPDGPARMRDSNPGVVRSSLGGVGRNIAHNLALLGVDTRLLTAYGNDDNARRVRESCRELGIDDSLSPVIPGSRTSTYLFLTDGQGDMVMAINDMGIYRHLTPATLETRMEAINGSAAVVLDTNLPQESIEYLAEHCTAPLFADPVSEAKCGKLKNILCKLHTLKPNRLEAEMLTGISITDDASLRRAAEALLGTGLRRVFLSLGGDGVLAAEPGRMVKLPVIPTEIANTTGAGDSMMAAVVRAFLLGRSLEDSTREGLAASSIAMETMETISPAMCPGAIAAKLGNTAETH